MNSDRLQIVAEIKRRRISAILRTDDAEVARKAMSAAVVGGFRMVEFTLTTPGAVELIAQFSRDDRLLVGAGTVLTRQQAREAVRAGARFLVSPICDAEIVAEANVLAVPCIPGAFTPTEMIAAHRLGADIIKLFPAPADVPSYIPAILGPLPFLKIFPTAGVGPDNLAAVLHAGAFGAGFVKALFDPADLARGDFDAVRQRAETICRSLPA